MAYEFVYNRFFENSIAVKPIWLDICLKYLFSKKPEYTNEQIAIAAFEQWLFTDLSLSTYPAYHLSELSLGRSIISHRIVLQVVSIFDIGNSLHSQYRNLTKKWADNSDFEAHNEDSNKFDKPQRMFLMEVSDGSVYLKAIEYRYMTQLSLFIHPGCKIFLRDDVVYRNGILYLTDCNCTVLGGDDEMLMKSHSPIEVISKRLKIFLKPANTKANALALQSKESESEDCKPKRKRVAVNTLFFPYSRGLLNYSSSSNTLANLPQSSAKPVMSVKPLSDSKESFNDDEVSQSTRLSEFLSSQNGSAFCKSLSAKYHCNASTSLHSLSYCAREPTHFNEIGSNIINTIHSSIHTEISSDAEKVENSSEKNHLVIRFMQLEIVWISDILKSLRFIVGSKKKFIMAILENVVNPLRIVDNLWTMTIALTDESHSNLCCIVAHSVLVELIGLTPQEAEAIRASRDKVRRREGTRRLKSVQESMERLDIIWEIEFFANGKSTPVIRNMKTCAQKLGLFD